MIGECIDGKYEVVAKLDEGGMGEVYRTEHRQLGRTAALKVMRSELSANKTTVQRFFNEARAASAIQHPGIIEILDFGYHGERAYILMEFLEGESLGARLERHRSLPVATALHFLRQILGALAAAHDGGIIHRDLKPENIFIITDPEVVGGERIKLLDFGIAKLVNDRANDVRTRTGSIMGTPAYMSPEQCRGAGRVDHRADIYSIGCILYHMLCGRTPFVSEGLGDLLIQQVTSDPTAPSILEPSIPARVEQFILRLMSKSPSDRPQTARAVIDELSELLAQECNSVPHAGRQPSVIAYADGAPDHRSVPESGHGVQTTLRGSAAAMVNHNTIQDESGVRARPRFIAILAAALVLGVALVLTANRAEPDRPSAATPAPAVAEPGATHTSVVAEPDASTERRDPPVRITSDPDGAGIFIGTHKLGVTPIELDQRQLITDSGVDGQVALEVRYPGYRSHELYLSAKTADDDRDEHIILIAEEATESATAPAADVEPRVDEEHARERSERKPRRRSSRAKKPAVNKNGFLPL